MQTHRSLEPRTRNAALRLVLLSLSLSAAACASSDEPAAAGPRGQCAAVRDHVVDLEIAQAQASGAALSAEIVEAHRASMVATLGDAYLDDCVDRGQAWIECAGRAATAGDVGACGEVAP